MTDSKSADSAAPARVAQWTLTKFAVGTPKDSDAKFETIPFDSSLKPGDLLLKMLYFGIDPFVSGYFKPIWGVVGAPVHSYGVGRVLKSNSDKYVAGDLVAGMLPWRDFNVVQEAKIERLAKGIKPSHAVGALGMPGACAYYGLYEEIKPKAGETLFVSTGAGAIGSLVGQLAKMAGMRVVASVGSPEKVKLCTEHFGFDAAIDYRNKTRAQLLAELKVVCPKGIDAYFDNTGGVVSEAVMLSLNRLGRVVVCGFIASGSQADPLHYEGLNYNVLLVQKAASIQGFHCERYKPWDKGLTALSELISAGKLKVLEDEVSGLENAMKALQQILSGESKGKKVLKVAD